LIYVETRYREALLVEQQSQWKPDVSEPDYADFRLTRLNAGK
jgi:hypothetical protein